MRPPPEAGRPSRASLPIRDVSPLHSRWRGGGLRRVTGRPWAMRACHGWALFCCHASPARGRAALQNLRASQRRIASALALEERRASAA